MSSVEPTNASSAVLKKAGALALIGLLCGLVLVATRQFTAGPIADNRALAAQQLYTDLLARPLDKPLIWHAGVSRLCAGEILLQLSEPGYASKIDFVGLWRPSAPAKPTLDLAQTEGADESNNNDRAPNTGGVSLRVVWHTETPGIGDFIDHARSDYVPTLDASDAATWAGLDTISGATITQQALQRAALAVFAEVTKPQIKALPCG